MKCQVCDETIWLNSSNGHKDKQALKKHRKEFCGQGTFLLTHDLKIKLDFKIISKINLNGFDESTEIGPYMISI